MMIERKWWTSFALSLLLVAGCDGGDPSPLDAGNGLDAAAQGCTTCDDVCVDVNSDPRHCGACGTECTTGQACVEGACEVLCPSGQIACDGVCADPQNDRRHCGACGAACASGEACVDGACALSCPEGQTVCGGACSDPRSDPANCGACGNACSAGQVCSEGACAATCGAGLTDCGGACVDTANDPGHCGACEAACPTAAGASGLCSAGSCLAVCDALAGDCNGDIASSSGDGCETPLATDPANCGACNHVCALPGATAGCDAGGCVIAACEPGFADCDGVDANGCEADLAHDDLHCGACGEACGAGTRCSGNECVSVIAEDCANAFVLSPGENTVLWTANAAEYLTTSPPCGAGYSLEGGDIVLSYTATIDERVTLELAKPASTRWAAVVSTASCGDLGSTLACISEFDGTTMGSTFRLNAGQTAYVYVRDTSSGDLPLSNPLTVNVTASDCTDAPAVTLDPPNGGTSTSLSPWLTATFAAPIISSRGTVTITGDMGGSASYDLSTFPSEVSVEEGNTVLSIRPSVAFQPGERLTVSMVGLDAVVCTTAVTVPPPAWEVNVPVPSCSPGVGGVVGHTVRTVPTDLSSTLFEYYVAADDDPNGYVYFGGTSDLYRMPKAGGPTEDIGTAAGLDFDHLGYAMLVDGPNIYTIESTTSGTAGRLFRISSDGGATWARDDYATFSPAPSDGFRSATVYEGRIYLATEEGTPSVPTEIWSVDAAATTLPATATLELTVENVGGDCNGLARDDAYYYLFCADAAGGLFRVPVTGGPAELITAQFATNLTAGALHGDDLDDDGVFDVLYAQSSIEEIYYVCDPGAPVPFADRFLDLGGGTGNYGLGFDRTNGVLWMYHDDENELLSIE